MSKNNEENHRSGNVNYGWEEFCGKLCGCSLVVQTPHTFFACTFFLEVKTFGLLLTAVFEEEATNVRLRASALTARTSLKTTDSGNFSSFFYKCSSHICAEGKNSFSHSLFAVHVGFSFRETQICQICKISPPNLTFAGRRCVVVNGEVEEGGLTDNSLALH